MSQTARAKDADHRDAVILLAIAFDLVCRQYADALDVYADPFKASMLLKADHLAQTKSATEKATLLKELWLIMDSVLPPDELA